MFRKATAYGVVALAMLAFSPAPAPGASKEILELQRDVATLQDMVKAMQRSQDERFAALQVLVQQSVNASNEASRAVAVIQSSLQQNLRDQESKVVTPVVSLGSRMDQVSNDVRTMGQAVSDLTGMISRLQSQLTDLNNAVKVMQAPAAPPPSGNGGAVGPGGPAGAPGGGEACGSSSTSLYENANRDRLGGKLDLALQEYADYLRCFSNTDLAPNAQFYIASIHYSQNDYEGAVRDFDTVLEKYGDTNKTPDAMFGKGQALVKMGRRTDGAREFQELIKKYPRSDFASKACDQLKGMGLSCGLRAAAPAKGAARKRK
jgi:TolA-binding protein